MVFNQTITILNYVEGTYKRTVLRNCMWRAKIDKMVSNNQIVISNHYSITIPFQSDYIEPSKITIDDDKWTLNAKNNQDIIILGEYNGICTPESFNKILELDNVGIIKHVSDNTTVPRLKHWKVTLA